jgi:hypothetical protein
VAATNGAARPLTYFVPPEATFPANCEGREALCDIVRRIAIDRAVMIAVANSHAPGLQGLPALHIIITILSIIT